MRVLSFDIGTKNLCYCLYDTFAQTIRDWQNMCLPQRNYTDLIPCLVRELRARQFDNVDVCVIERQPRQNAKMRVVMAAVQTFFVMQGARVELFDPKKKFACRPGVAPPSGKAGYYARKQLAVKHARAWLEEHNEKDWLRTFTLAPKKDDLADSLLQAVSFAASAAGVASGAPAQAANVVICSDIEEGEICDLESDLDSDD